jgi:hypothetical protein
MPFQFSIATPGVIGGPTTHTMLSAITTLGLSTGLKLCLDAGDGTSVAVGTQTKWLDVSGGGYDFFRGTDITSQASDPTFNGTPNAQSSAEYYSFDGGDRFTYDTTVESWMNAIHEASAVWAFAGWVYLPTASGGTFAATRSAENKKGFVASSSAAGGASLTVAVDSDAGDVFSFTQSNGAVGSAWNFIAATINAASGTRHSQVNGTSQSGAATYSAPGSGAAHTTMALGTGIGAVDLPNGSRMANWTMWQGSAPSAGALNQLFQYTRAKFGI